MRKHSDGAPKQAVMRLIWITDPHLNFLPSGGSAQFGSYLAQEHPDCEMAVITGDIAEAPSVCHCLKEFAEGFGKTVAVTLGNHDYYRGSIAAVEKAMAELVQPLVWLDELAEPVLLDNDTALVGQGGWYDGLLGNAEQSRILMSDFELISDFRKHYRKNSWLYDPGSRTTLLDLLRTLSRQHAEAARVKLLAAMKQRKHVIFATHYPPFAGACWHEGAISNSHWMPWFTSGAMGQMLGDVAAENPDNRILVLCGHMHSSGFYEHLPNLFVMTGKAVYGAPDVAGVLTLPLPHWTSTPDRCDRCDDQDFEVSATLIGCKTCNRVWGRVNGAWILDPTS